MKVDFDGSGFDELVFYRVDPVFLRFGFWPFLLGVRALPS